MSALRLQTQGISRLRNGILATTILVAVPFVHAQASTLGTFEWVDTAGSTGSGTLEILLPGTVTNKQFSIGPATFAEITAFTYKFSSGLTAHLADLTSHVFSPPDLWTTTTITSSTVGGSGMGDSDLTTGFTFSGANNLKIANSEGTLFNIQMANNLINPASGGVSNDFGFWKLETLQPVPLPAALPLLLSGLGLIGVARRRRFQESAEAAIAR